MSGVAGRRRRSAPIGIGCQVRASSEFSLTWRLARNALPLLGLNFRTDLADLPDCADCCSGLEETTEHAFYYCQQVRPFLEHVEKWTARIEPKQLVLLDVGYVVDNVLPPFQGEKCVGFLTILAEARMVIWTTRKKGSYDDANFSHRDLVLFFRHRLRVKIRCDRKTLGSHNIRQMVVECSELGHTKGGYVGVILPSSSCAWRLRSGSFGTLSRVSRLCFPLNTWLAVCCESSSLC